MHHTLDCTIQISSPRKLLVIGRNHETIPFVTETSETASIERAYLVQWDGMHVAQQVDDDIMVARRAVIELAGNRVAPQPQVKSPLVDIRRNLDQLAGDLGASFSFGRCSS